MKKLYFVLMALALVASACQLGGGQAEPTAIPLNATAVPLPTTVTHPTEGPQGGEAGEERVASADGMTQVFVPDGTFMRGGIDPEAAPHEMPSTKITMTGFWMDKVEVTNGMYMLCVTAGVCEMPHYISETVLKSATREDYFRNPEFADYPVVYVAWGDADSYCKWAGRRLPTEAEWEYAARGAFPSFNTFPWGEARPDGSTANFNSMVGDTMKVGSYPSGASPFGILDMAGNVAEWVNDYYDSKYYDLGMVLNPTGPVSRSDVFSRVVRGGHWGNAWMMLRVSARATMMGPNPAAQMGTDRWYGESANSVGFRCAADK